MRNGNIVMAMAQIICEDGELAQMEKPCTCGDCYGTTSEQQVEKIKKSVREFGERTGASSVYVAMAGINALYGELTQFKEEKLGSTEFHEIVTGKAKDSLDDPLDHMTPEQKKQVGDALNVIAGVIEGMPEQVKNDPEIKSGTQACKELASELHGEDKKKFTWQVKGGKA